MYVPRPRTELRAHTSPSLCLNAGWEEWAGGKVELVESAPLISQLYGTLTTGWMEGWRPCTDPTCGSRAQISRNL